MLRNQEVSLRAYAVIVRDGRMLLCRLGALSNDPGLWTLPGGGGEFGESPQDTCHREVMEETGLEVDLAPSPRVDSRVWNFPDRDSHHVRFLFPARICGGALRDEAAGTTDHAAWVPLAALPTLPRADIVDLAMEMVREKSLGSGDAG